MKKRQLLYFTQFDFYLLIKFAAKWNKSRQNDSLYI